ncbi:hypothetical protein [Flavobacterium sp. FlaQc-47]|uniref:hypothetical protein n=1 Tax=Flavobacterium sp. FlaQc-47 TaxID=3374180 RepID=UPI003757F90F
MKTIKTLLAIFVFAQIGYSQQLVQNINDIYRLKEYEAIFVNKPLKDLIKEIKPEIKIAFPNNQNPSFDFRFVTHEQLRKDEGTIAENVSLFVGVNDFIDWNWETRPKGKEPVWTKEDAEKYGNLIVTRINIVY